MASVVFTLLLDDQPPQSSFVNASESIEMIENESQSLRYAMLVVGRTLVRRNP